MENLKWKEHKIIRNRFLLGLLLFISIIIVSCYSLSNKVPVYESYSLVACYKQLEGSEKGIMTQKHYCDFENNETHSIREVLYKPYTYDDMNNHKRGTKFNLEDHTGKNIWAGFNILMIIILTIVCVYSLIDSGLEGSWHWQRHKFKSYK